MPVIVDTVSLTLFSCLPLIQQDDGAPVSVFSLSGSSANDGHLVAGRNGVKRLRTVRSKGCIVVLVDKSIIYCSSAFLVDYHKCWFRCEPICQAPSIQQFN